LVAFRAMQPFEAIFLLIVENLIGSTIALLAMLIWPSKLLRRAAEPDHRG
jgi:hypothetical protein